MKALKPQALLGLSLAIILTTDRLQSAERLVCCGGAEVFVIEEGLDQKLWSWQATDSPSIPSDFVAKFRSTDECKPYEGDRLLITSSSSGVALIDRASKRCLFLAEARNAHSACLLPNNNLVVASSFGGDELLFYSRAQAAKPATPSHAVALEGAHGTVWDAQRQCLWALGERELLQLKSDSGDEPWKVVERYKLPTTGGHDLSWAEPNESLFVTTNSQVLEFSCAMQTFDPYTQISNPRRVKSIDRHPKLKRVVYHQASEEHWWSDSIRYVDGKTHQLEAERLYKVRWDIDQPRP